MLHGKVIQGYGPPRPVWAAIGERPGQEEAARGRPFVGKTGDVLTQVLEHYGLRRDHAWIDNVVRDYAEGNPAPSEKDVERWRRVVLKDLRDRRPRYIVAMGYHAIRWFLGDSAWVEATHGIPHRWSDGNGYEATILPTYHPAAPFYNPDLLAHLHWDFKRAARVIKTRTAPDAPVDEFPEPDYRMRGHSANEERYLPRVVGLDSEGRPGDVWSFQTSGRPGSGRVWLGRVPPLEPGSTLVFHNGMYEIEMARSLGHDLLDPDYGYKFWDTMMAAYLLCIEPQSLKMLARRWCGMEMKEYSEVVGDVGLKKQLAYLERVSELDWPRPEARLEWSNDGTCRMYTPQPVGRRAEAILLDYYSEKLNKDGERTDPLQRWHQCDRALRRMVEARLGRMPLGTLADVPLRDAVHYAGRDPDACMRLKPVLEQRLAEEGLTELFDLKMRMLPVAAQMKMNGILGKREAFEALSELMWDEMSVLSRRIGRAFFDGKPFNPNSSDQVATLMRKRGLKGEKRTDSGKMSTSKKSIEHLRYEDQGIEWVEQWRERMKAKTSFADPVLENWPEELPLCRIRGDLKITRVTSGRFSMALIPGEPSAPLMAIPVRTELGIAVRNCYVAEEGYQLFEADLDQAEMRIMADESGDSRLIKLFNEGKVDVHGDTASKIFRVSYEEVMSKSGKMKYRYPAKRAGFGIITGIQGPGLLDQLRMAGCLGWDIDKCDQLIEDWLGLAPKVPVFMDWCAAQCRENGGVIRDRWGMPRHLPNIFSPNKWERLEARRQSHSHRIQGGAQGWLQHVMARLQVELADYIRGRHVRWLLQVHDSLMLEVRDDATIRAEVERLVIHAMCSVAKLKVPMMSSGTFARSWGALK